MPPAAAIELIQLTDTHFARDAEAAFDEINVRASLAAVLADVRGRALPVQAILATGDLSHDASAESYIALREALQLAETPVFCIAGNHDDPATMQDYLTGGWVTRAPEVVFEPWQIIALDTHVPGAEHGELGAERLALLHDLLAASHSTHTLIALHHPPVSIDSPWMDAMGLRDARDFFDVIGRCPRVRGVVWGHVHQAFDRDRGGVRLLATPSTCVQFKPGAERFRRDYLSPGYRRLRLLPDGRIDTAVVRVDLSAVA